MPFLFFFIILISIYSSYIGDLEKTIAFLFKPDFSLITPQIVISAMGQAFFSLSVGMGAIMAYGAYMPENRWYVNRIDNNFIRYFCCSCGWISYFSYCIGKTSLQITAGPGLIWNTSSSILLITFRKYFFTIFILVTIAALSSSISLLELFTAWIEENWKDESNFNCIFSQYFNLDFRIRKYFLL